MSIDNNIKNRAQKSYANNKDKIIFLTVFNLIGSTLLLLIILGLVDITFKQLILNPENFFNVAKDPIVIQSISLTFYTAFLATLVTFVLGIPLSYILAMYQFKGKNVLEALINLPLMIPHSVAGLLIYSLFSRRGLLGEPLTDLNIIFEDNMWGIVIAMIFVSMPIFLNSAIDGFKSIDPQYAHVAQSLGATESQTFFKIMLPLNKRTILTGSVMCWARAISAFGAVILIAYYPMIAPVLVYYRFNMQGLSGSGPIALLLILISLLIFIFLAIYRNRAQANIFGEN